jgi:dCMP deaminase
MADKVPDTRPDWDTYFLMITSAVSARGECARRRVGAIIVDDQQHIVDDPGYNGAAKGMPNCFDGACPRRDSGLPSYDKGNQNFDNCIAIHAEANALLKAGRRANGCTMYVSADPCYGCVKLALGASIRRIVTPGIIMDMTDHHTLARYEPKNAWTEADVKPTATGYDISDDAASEVLRASLEHGTDR